MKWGRSLSFRVIGYLMAAQLFAFIVGWGVSVALGLYGVEGFATSLDELAYPRMEELVLASLVRNDSGFVRIEPTPALRAEMARAPGLKFAAIDPARWQAVPGSSPELASVLTCAAAIKATWVSFSLDDFRDGRPTGYLQPRNTPFGRFQIVIDGFRFRLEDIYLNLWHHFKWFSVYFAPVAALSAGTAWFAVRRGLAPLRGVASEAAAINMNSLEQRLSEDGVPTEIEPLVDNMNEALGRLDAGAARLRRFTANAAHELRTPVAILTARLDAPKTSSFLVDLQRDAHRIRNIVEQLLSATRLSERPAEIGHEVDLVAMAHSKAADAMLIAIQHGQQIEFEGPSTPVIVSGNRLALESVISNLIDNALRAEPKGGTVLVRVSSDATVEVVDHGEGVSKSDQGKIFEPFWRKSEVMPGSGLGLAIAKDLIEKHNGRIWVEDTRGGGATFKLRLPQGK